MYPSPNDINPYTLCAQIVRLAKINPINDPTMLTHVPDQKKLNRIFFSDNPRVDFMSLDIEGADMQVLKTIFRGSGQKSCL